MAILSALKGIFTVFNVLVLILIIAFILKRYKKIKAARALFVLSFILFIICSTAYLPQYLAGKLERKYPVYSKNTFPDSGNILIHVLGSGYNLDKRLPANAQLGWCALGRLAEAIRIHQLLKNSTIVCSANAPETPPGLETQAQVTRRAAIALGVDSNHVATLNTPATTQEEASDLAKQYDTNRALIIVTDAIHMPRAMKLFSKAGFHPVAAPTNYKILEGPIQDKFKWWPSFENMGLMNYVIHEWLGQLKASIAG